MITAKSYISFCWAALTALLLSCSSDIEELTEQMQEQTAPTLELNVSVNETRIDTSKPTAGTRSIESITATTFSNGEEIGVVVFEGGNYMNNYRYKMVNGEWVAQGDKYTKPATAVTNTYLVYSPYDASISNPANPEAAIADLKTRHHSVLNQSDPAVYHNCDLMTQTIQQSSNEIRLYATLEHEYSAFLIDFRQCRFHTTVTDRDVSWPSEIVGKDDAAANISANYSEEKSYVAVSTDGGATYQRYIPFLNKSADDGDDYYRFIVEPTNETVKLEWHQKYIEVVRKNKAQTKFEKGNLYRASGIFRVNESDFSVKVGDIYCRDEVDETGNTGVVLPLSMFKYAKYNEGKPSCTKLLPLGIVFSDLENLEVSQKDRNDGYRGYCISLRYSDGKPEYKWQGGDFAWSIASVQTQTEEDYINPIRRFNKANMFDGVKWGEDYDGYTYCKAMQDHYGDATIQSNYPALYMALHFADDDDKNFYPQFKLPNSTTGWYLPTAGQYLCFMKNLAECNLTQYQDNTSYKINGYDYVFSSINISVMDNQNGGHYGSTMATYNALKKRIDMINEYMEGSSIVDYAEDFLRPANPSSPTNIPSGITIDSEGYGYVTLNGQRIKRYGGDMNIWTCSIVIPHHVTNLTEFTDYPTAIYWDSESGNAGYCGFSINVTKTYNRWVRPVFAFK